MMSSTMLYWKPGKSRSTMKAAMPLWPRDLSVWATSRKMSARPQNWEQNILRPLMCQLPSAPMVAVVSMPEASLPTLGSVSAVAGTISPAMSLGRYLSLSSGLAYRTKALPSMLTLVMPVLKSSFTVLRASSTPQYWTRVAPMPPYSSGRHMPTKPISASSLLMARAFSSLGSGSPTRGASRFSANCLATSM